MSSALSKSERILKVGPYILWFGLHTIIGLLLFSDRGLKETVYFLVIFVVLGSLNIWLFGYKLFPEYLAREGKINFRISLLIGINIILFVLGIYAPTIMDGMLDVTQIADQYAPKSVRIALWILMVLLGITYMASIRVTSVYHLRDLQRIEHKAERAEAELKLLKSQISPHFLFNTLNNIYGLAYLGDERAAEMISKLSKLLRYLLYDCDQPEVPLLREKELIENYLSIQLLKHEESVNVDFYHAGITNRDKIAPMILINFIENCFKHSDLENNPQGWIKISLEVEDHKLNFRAENTTEKKIEELPVDRKGIGLTNSLKLLQANYPEKHKVEIREEDQVYQLDLTITL
ncbi:MAG: sensor histidine kinase [Bacteroidota bacterium]